MEDQVFQKHKKRLFQCLETCDIPEERYGDIKWLNANLLVKNSHPEAIEAHKIVNMFLRHLVVPIGTDNKVIVHYRRNIYGEIV